MGLIGRRAAAQRRSRRRAHTGGADSVAKTLQRRIGNWARRAARACRDAEAIAHDAATARDLIAPIVERLGEVGLVDDAAFATNRAKRTSTSERWPLEVTFHDSKSKLGFEEPQNRTERAAAARIEAITLRELRTRLGVALRIHQDARLVEERPRERAISLRRRPVRMRSAAGDRRRDDDQGSSEGAPPAAPILHGRGMSCPAAEREPRPSARGGFLELPSVQA